MKKYFLLISLLGGSSMYASDQLTGIENTNAQIFEETTDTQNLDEGYQGEYDFPKDEYQHYMSLIKKVDPATYAKFKKHEEDFHEDAFSKAVTIEPTVLLPKEESQGYPVMVLPSLLDLPEAEQEAELIKYLDSYNALENQKKIDEGFYQPKAPAEADQGSYQGEYDFPQAEYEQYMKLLQELAPDTYKNLRQQEQALGRPALSKAVDIEPTVLAPSEETSGYPEIVIRSIVDLPEAEQQTYFLPFIHTYQQFTIGYGEAMRLIESLDPSTHENLKKCEQELSQRCLLVQETYSQVIPPTEASHGYPLIVIQKQEKNSSYFNFNLQHALTRTVIPRYNELIKSAYNIPETEVYGYWPLVQKINPTAYLAIRPTCFKRAAADYTGPTVYPDPYGGLPYLVIPATKNPSTITINDLTDPITEWYKLYKQTLPPGVPEDERAHFLEIIKELAPKLYTKIIAIDPTGEHHILRHEDGSNASVIPLLEDGFPLIRVGTEIRNFPLDWQKFIIGHELGHYVLGHFKTHAAPHDTLNTENEEAQEYASGKKMAGQLPFKPTFEKAFSRIQEYEADRFSILGFGTAIDDGIAWRQERIKQIKKEEGVQEHPEKETFNRTHPQDDARIKHLESLRPEVELQKAHGETPPPIDWNALIEKYKKGSWEELQEAL